MIDTRVRTFVPPELIRQIEERFAESGPGPKRKVFTLVNNKGGAGKTHDVLALALILDVCFGLHVLIIDMDPQANATRRVGHGAVAMQQRSTLTEALKMAVPGLAKQIVLSCTWEEANKNGSIDILPARLDLENRVNEAATADAVAMIEEIVRREQPDLLEPLGPIFKQVVGSLDHPRQRLRTILAGGFLDAYDIVLIDCPPSLGHLTQNAYVASDGVFLCTTPSFDSVNGAVRTRTVLQQTRAELGVPGLEIHGVFVTDLHRTRRADATKGTVGAAQYAEKNIQRLRSSFGPVLVEPFMERKSAVAENTDLAVAVTNELLPKDLEYVNEVLIRWAARLLEVSCG